jgi:DNA-binding PadR family transcriptional regulator
MKRSLSSELSLFSYEILALVGRTGAGAHDLVRWARRGRMLAWAGESQYYAEPKRLARLGYLDARREPGKTRERTVYSLTDRGLDALRAYAETPATFTPLKSDPLLRLLLADLVGEDVTRAGLAGLREELVELHARLDESVATAESLPHRARYLLLAISFLRRYLDLHADLIDEFEQLGDDGEIAVSRPS